MFQDMHCVVENGTETMIAPLDRQFNSKTVGQRAMAIFAGPLFNFILAFFIFLLIGLIQGVPTYEPVITSVVDDGPAATAGLQAGDLVTAIDGTSITTWQELSATIQKNPGQALALGIEREGTPLTIDVTPKTVEESGRKIWPDGCDVSKSSRA